MRIKEKWKKICYSKKRFCNKHYLKIIIVSGLFFPLIVGGVYALPLPQIIEVSSEGLLSFYGAFLGICATFVTYRKENERKEKERRREIKPVFSVKLERSKNEENEYRLILYNVSTHNICNVFLYDEYWKNVLGKGENKTNIGFYKTVEEEKMGTASLKFNSNIELDEQGYPKELYFTCEDVDGNYWMCSFNKVEVDGEKRYFPEDFFVL